MNLHEFREKHGWTQTELSQIAEVDLQAIEDAENGVPVEWTLATRIAIKIRNYIGNQAIRELDIPQRRDGPNVNT